MKKSTSRKSSQPRRRSRSVQGVALTSVLCAAGNFAAQGASPTEVPEVVVTDSAPLYKPETVSSPKLQGPLRDIPQTIAVIPQEVIKEQGASSLRDVLKNTPGISIQAGEGGGGPAGDNLSIRGFSAKTDIFVDGTRDFGGYTRDPFNIEQVEVTKGPSSANGGRGSTGGSVNLVSKMATLSPFTTLDVTGGTNDLFRTTLDFNQPLWVTPGTAATPASGGKDAKSVQPAVAGTADSGASLRLNGLYHEAGVSGRDYAEEQRWGVGASLAFGLGTDTRAYFNYFHLEQDNQPDYGIPWVPETVTNAAGAVVPIDPSLRPYINKPAPVPFNTYYGSLVRDYEKISTDIATFRFEHDFSETLHLRDQFRVGRTERDSVTTAPRFTGVGTMLKREFQARDQHDDILSNQTDLTAEFNTGSVKHTLVTGFELAREESGNRERAISADSFTDLYNPHANDPILGQIAYTGGRQSAEVNSAAAYMFDKIEFDKHWEFNGGLRWDYLDTDYSATDKTGIKTDLNRTDALLSYRAALVFKPVDKGSIYFAYGTSFNPSTELLVSSSAKTAITQFDTDPEKNRSYELGTKWDLAGERLSLTAAVFRTEKTNARTADPTDPTVFELTGEQVVQGAEIGLAGTLADNWRVFAGYVYLDSKVSASANPLEVGNDVANTPRNTASFWTVYDLPYGFQIGAGAQFVDSRFNNNASQRQAPSYYTFDAMLGYQVNKNVSLRLNVYNLADEDYIDRVGGGHFVPGAGRSASLSATVKF